MDTSWIARAMSQSRLVDAKPEDLLRPDPDVEERLRAVTHVNPPTPYCYETVLATGHVIRGMARRLLEGTEHPGTDRFHKYLSLSLPLFLAGMARVEGYTFLDVGCGIGDKVMLAQALGFEAFGFDYWEPYIKVAQSLQGSSVWVDDAFAFEGYSGYDVVYSWRLCRDHGEQEALNQHITSWMKPGSFAFLVGTSEIKGDHLEPLGNSVWRVT